MILLYLRKLKKIVSFILIKWTYIAFVELDKRIRNIKYISELTKFNIFPTINNLNCFKELLLLTINIFILKRLLEDFGGNNIELTVQLLENCGAYLYRKKDSTFRFGHLLNTLDSHRKSKNIPL